MVKVFKNGKIKLGVPKRDPYFRDANGKVLEDFYHGVLFWDNIYIESIEGNWYIVNFSNKRVYNYYNSYLVQNPLKVLLDDLTENEVIYLYPMSARESKQLLKQYYEEQEELA